MSDLTKLYRDATFRVPLYKKFAENSAEVAGQMLTMTMWSKQNVPGHTSFRCQIHDATGVELYDGDDSYDTGNAIHNANAWLDGWAKQQENAAPAAQGA